MSNFFDSIAAIARKEAKCLRPLRLSEIDNSLPYICIDNMNVSAHGHEGHDNEPRMPFICSFITNYVIPLIDPSANVSGKFRIELHDSYSYLDIERNSKRSIYNNCMVFSRDRHATENVALIPDPFHMSNFGGMLRICDTIPWKDKSSKLFFAGTTTGDRNPLKNERINACIWSLSHPQTCDFRITQIAQMQSSCIPKYDRIVHAHVPLHEHFNYKYLVNIVGNTACWSRVPMIMNSSSLMINLRHKDVMWYYPLLMSNTHFVDAFDCDDMLKKRHYFESSPNGYAESQRIVKNANLFVQDFLKDPLTAASYMANLLEESTYLNAP